MVPLDSERQPPVVVRSSDIVWRATHDRVLVRRVGSGTGAELVGLAALTWVAADAPSTTVALARELEVDEPAVVDAVSMLLSSGWLEPVPR